MFFALFYATYKYTGACIYGKHTNAHTTLPQQNSPRQFWTTFCN